MSTGWATEALAERACSLAAEQNAAGKCSSRPFFPEHLVLCGLAAVSAKGPSGAQPPVPGKGLRLWPRWAGLVLSPRCLWAQAWPSVVSLPLAAPCALKDALGPPWEGLRLLLAEAESEASAQGKADSTVGLSVQGLRTALQPWASWFVPRAMPSS